MTTRTIPAFTNQITSGQGETKIQRDTRKDRQAASIYDKRPLIDRWQDEQRLKRELEEMEL